MLRDYKLAQERWAREQRERRKMPQAFGEFITNLTPWDWWVTITFRNEVKSPEAGVSSVKEWLALVEIMAGNRIGYVIAEEFGGWGGRFHCHLLVSGVRSLQRKFWWGEAFRRFGRTRIEPFDPEQAAAYYAAKYAAKQLGRLHFGGFFEGQEVVQTQERFELTGQGAQVVTKRGCEIAPSADMPRDFYRMTSTRWHR